MTSIHRKKPHIYRNVVGWWVYAPANAGTKTWRLAVNAAASAFCLRTNREASHA
jgi:hypothetical protein